MVKKEEIQMKKLVAVLVALMMVLGMTAAVADDAEVPTYTCGDYQYQLLDDGTAMITLHLLPLTVFSLKKQPRH